MERFTPVMYGKRIKVLRAMETLARAVNDETLFEEWLMCGVADGDITADTADEDLLLYVHEDDDFADIMDTFLHIMHKAFETDGLYVDEVVSCPKNW